MKSARLLLHACLYLGISATLPAGLTYVDATDGPGGNTTLANGNPLLADDASGGVTWRQRDNAAFGSAGTVFEGTDPSPEIKTTIAGLIPGHRYRVQVHFFEKTSSTAEKWNVRAGFVSGNLALFANPSDGLAGATAAVVASTLSYDSPPTVFAGTGTNMAGFVGTATADGTGKIVVFLDDFPSTDVNLRTWYDGLSYEEDSTPANAVTYVDATTGNTTRWDGQPFGPAAEGNVAIDNNWEIRTLGNGGNAFESNADGPEDAPLLVTTLTGLAPNSPYVLYTYFWDASSGNWRIKSSAKPASIDPHGTPGNLSDDFLPAKPLTAFAADDDAGGAATRAAPASTSTFVTNPLFTQADRVLMQAPLGVATSDSSGRIAIYVDDFAGTAQDQRTWFDGVGYKLAQPLDPDRDEDGDGLKNGAETAAGTDPYLPDTDGDTFSDAVEIAAGSDPLDPLSIPALPGNSLQLTADGAWTWFNDERAIFHQGSLYLGYVTSAGQTGVTRYDPATNESFDTIISTATSQQKDDHNNPSLTVLPDGRLMALYAKHRANSVFYQRTSLVSLPSSLADWGPEIVVPLTASFGTYDNTYNDAYLLSAESNRIYNFHRYINFNPTITVSDDLGATWKPSVPFIEVGSGNVRPYPRYVSNGTDRIDLIYTDGHPRDVDNSVYHMYYRNGGFYKTDGTLIDTYANLPLDHEGGQRGSTIYQYSAAPWGAGEGPDDWIPNARGWTWDVHYDKQGNLVCVFQVQVGTDATWSASRIYYYYARWTGTAWQKRFIAQAGRAIYAAESDYGGGMCIDPGDTNVIYISSNAASPFELGNISNVPLNANSRFEIYKGITRDGGLTFEWSAVTANSESDNLRPIVPENSPFDHTLLWVNGAYSSYTNFSTRVLGILRNDLKLESSSFAPATDSGSMTWKSSPGWRYRITGSADLHGFPLTVATGIDSQGAATTRGFTFPPALRNSPRAFFRVETE